MASLHFDGIKKCLTENEEALIYVIDATNIVQESLERLNAWPPAAVHLGQAMMGVLLLQAMSEKSSPEKVSLQWTNEGPFGHLFVEARNYGEVRGTIYRPQAPVEDFNITLGTGLLQVRRSTNTSITSVVNAQGDIALDIVEFLEKSEQRNAGMNLSVKIGWTDESKTQYEVQQAVGYLIDILPQNTEQKRTEALLRWDRQMRTLGHISKWIFRSEKSLDDMLELITGEVAPNIIMNQRVKFSCNCTEERASKALALANAQDGKSPNGPTQIQCEYCGKEYLI